MSTDTTIKKARLLIADDEPDFTAFVKWQLELSSYQVLTAASGQEALDIMMHESVDLLLADIRMPGMDGLELIRQALEAFPDLQCIVITGHGDMDTAVSAMRLGAVNYLSKPVGLDELEVAVKKGLEKLALIRTVKEKTERLEQANKELRNLKQLLEESLKTETAERRKAETALKTVQLRELLVETLSLSLRYWKQAAGKSKIELSEESRIWTVTLDKGGTYRARTFDRYLRIHTMPPRPRINDVLDTGYFVLSKCPEIPKLKERLEEKIRGIEKLMIS